MRGFPDKAYYALRFQILQRDNFTCRYCGQHAPNVILHVDHVLEICEGGTDDPDNLVTSCSACNIGKEALRARTVGRKGRLSRWAAARRQGKSKPNPNEPSWDEMVTLEPRLIPLLDEVLALNGDEGKSFCPHWFWFGRGNGKESLRNRLSMLVGWESGYGYNEDYDDSEKGFVLVGAQPERERIYEVPEKLRTTLAYDAAYRKLFEALPPHRNCYHTEVQPWMY